MVMVGVCSWPVAVIALAVGLVVGLSQGSGVPSLAPTETPSVPHAGRIDCYPEAKWGGAAITREDCESRGCTYDPPMGDGAQTAPACYVSPDSPLGSGYKVQSDVEYENGARKIVLESRSPSAKGVKRSAEGQKGSRQLEKENAVFEMEYGGENILHFKLYPEGGAARYEVPRSILDIVLPGLRPGTKPSYIFNITNFDPFTFQIRRRSTGTILWDTSVGGTVVSDQFLSISTILSSQNVYGFGENVHNSFRHDFNHTTWPLFARDQRIPAAVENHYGVHPFFLCLEETGSSHGVLLLNSTAMEYSFAPLPMLTYRTIGGVLDFYFFLGPTPENVVQQYTALIGRPYMPPYSSLEEQLDRYGYETIEKMKEAVDRTSAAGIPQDPANFNEEVTRLSRDALLIRYHLLPYLYTLFHAVHTKGGTVVRPLHHEFPKDAQTWGIDKQFLWGSSLMVVPILEEHQSVLKYYLPTGRWYDFYTNASMVGGSWKERDVVSDSSIPLFVRGGTIFPTQDRENNTHYSRLNPFRCLVYLDADDGKATGDLFWDDGVSIGTYENGNYYSAHMDAKKDEFRFRIQHNTIPSEMTSLRMSSVQVVGVTKAPVQVLMTTASKGTVIIPNSNYEYSTTTQLLMIKNLEQVMTEDFTIRWRSSPVPTIAEADRIDCMPEGGDAMSCVAKGCLWNTSVSTGVPPCYLDSSSYGYTYVDHTAPNSTHDTIRLHRLPGSASMFGEDVEQVNVYLDYLNDWLIRIKIFPVGVEPAYEVPVPLNLPTPVDSSTRLYSVAYESTGLEPFYIKVQRKETSQVVWDTSIGGLTISPQFLQLAARLPTTYVYGLGENSRSSFRRKFEYETVAMFARDQPPGDETANLYGVHPYYVCVDNTTTGAAHGVLLLNSNAMEVVLGPAPSITYRTIGGLLDFYIIFGDGSETVTSRYTQLIGRPYLPPYWSLGFQLSRYGYNSLANMEAAVQRTLDAEIPMDVQYGDIDHFETQKDFTYDLVNFAGLPQFVDQLHNQGMRFITILDPAIMSTDPNYWPHTDGVAADVFIRWPIETNHSDFYRFNSTYMFGYVWPPGETLFPDFFKAETKNWWINCILRHHQNAFPFDGLWIDMNEPANFGTNEEKPFNWPEDREPWSLKCPTGPLDDPPYKPKAIWGPRLSDKTICLVGLQTDGVRNYTQYDVHNIYGWSQIEPSLKAIQEATGERSIVISRSTYVGSGQHGGHWLGDNDSAQWLHMLHSIIGCLDFNLFGIPYIGADICGHFNNATAAICNRWTQLGAFYTFSRNHNGRGYEDKDPGAFGPEVAQSAKFITDIRYSLLPYLYTLFFRAHVDGHTVIRPLFHEFKTDLNAYDVDRQFLWGPALLVTPVIEEDQTSVCGYLANGARWFSFFDGLEEPATGAVCFDAPLDRIPLHVRGGQIIATQEPAINTNRSRLNPFGLIVAPDALGSATGELFWDDGVSVDTVISNQYYLFNYTLNMVPSGSNSTLTAQTSARPSSTSLTLPALASIRIFGVSQLPSGVVTTVLGVVSPVDAVFYDSTTQELYLYNLTIPMDSNWVTVWW